MPAIAGLDATLDVALRPSPSLRSISAAVHLLVVCIVAVIATHRPVFWAVLPIAVFLAWRSDCLLGLRGRGACTRFRWSADQRVQWIENAYAPIDGHCSNAESWGALWVRLTFRAASRRLPRRIIIPRDAVDAQTHRRLRARCRVMPPSSE